MRFFIYNTVQVIDNELAEVSNRKYKWFWFCARALQVAHAMHAYRELLYTRA